MDLLNKESEEMRNKKSAHQRQYEQVIDKLTTSIREIKATLELMPSKGDTSDFCQKLLIINHLNSLSYCVDGIEINDFIPNHYSGVFKLSYS